MNKNYFFPRYVKVASLSCTENIDNISKDIVSLIKIFDTENDLKFNTLIVRLFLRFLKEMVVPILEF